MRQVGVESLSHEGLPGGLLAIQIERDLGPIRWARLSTEAGTEEAAQKFVEALNAGAQSNST